MARFLPAVMFAALVLPSGAQPPTAHPLSLMLNFEGQLSPGRPRGWGGNPRAAFADDQVVHQGKWAARIEHEGPGFSTITTGVAIDFKGKKVELRAFLRGEGRLDPGGLWMRLDGPRGSVAFESMQKHGQSPGKQWKEFTLTLPLNRAATKLIFGALATGNGKVWVDDMMLFVDGKPIWEVSPGAMPIH